MIDYSLALIEDETIDVADLHPRVLEPRPERSSLENGFYAQVAAHEAAILRTAYAKAEGNVSRLALQLGMDRSHLHTKLKLYGIRPLKGR